MKWNLAICLLACCGHAAASGSPVERVVNLLGDLKDRLVADEKSEQQSYDKYACWCEETSKRKAASINKAQDDLRALGQSILTVKSRIAVLSSEITEYNTNIADNKAAQEKATAIRQKQNAGYTEQTTEMKSIIATLQNAITVLMDGTSFLQGPAKVNSALKAVVDAMPTKAALHPRQIDQLKLLQGNMGVHYMPQSLTVQGILGDLYHTFASDLESSTVAEADQNKEFESYIAVKVESLNEMEKEKAIREDEKAKKETLQADTQAIYDDTSAQKAADIAFFDQTKASCMSKHKSWTTRSSMRDEEVAGIEKALDILSSDSARELFASTIKEGKETGADNSYDTGRDVTYSTKKDITSFLQVGKEHPSTALVQAYKVLKGHASEVHSLRLAALAVRVGAMKVGHFDQVVKAISDMIHTLTLEGQADIEKRDQCKQEYQNIESTVRNVTWLIERNTAKIASLTRLIEKRTEEKVQTMSDIDEVRAHMQTSEQTRVAENTAFLASKAEDQNAIDLLVAARTALSKYYKNHSIALGPIQGAVKGLEFAQQPDFDVSADQSPDAVFSDGGARKKEAKGILQILTMIVEDVNDEIKNDMKAEEEAQLEFEALMKAAKKLEKDLLAKKQSLINAIAQRKTERGDEQIDKSHNEGDLQDEVDYKASITDDCDWIIRTFETRAKARTAEMEGLTGAKQYLAGSTEGAVFLVKPKASPAFDDHALFNDRFMGLPR